MDGERLGAPIEATYEGTSDEDAISELYASGLVGLARAATILRIVAIVAAVVWTVAVVTTFWTLWQQFADLDAAGFSTATSAGTNDRLLRTVANTLGQTPLYAIVAVLAYAAATFAEARRTGLLLDALEE